MDKKYFFDRNLLALSQKNAELCARLSKAETTLNRYKFLESRSGEVIPASVTIEGTAHPLHSTMDPQREANRLIDSQGSEGFLVFLGLGGGYYVEAALQRSDVGLVLVIEYDLNGLAELLCHKDYARLFGDPRFRLITDVSGQELEKHILDLYQPVLYGGIRVIPLRSRTKAHAELFSQAGNAISSAIDRISSDYSVQAHFGKRWFSNIIRNIKNAEKFHEALPPIRHAAVCAAGPSLTSQLPRLKERRKDLFLIATDTSLPCLLHAEIQPDAVISIDCQHISYHHFLSGLPEKTLLFLDLASLPMLSSLSKRTQFFSGGHPLARYVSRVFRPLPELDTSGGNVTYAAVSLAEQLGALEIHLYGADFSYPAGVCYAKGTYIYSMFLGRQNRFLPLQAQNSHFVFRTPVEKKTHPDGLSWYYETKTLAFYRRRLEEKSEFLQAAIFPAESKSTPLHIAGNSKIRQRSLKIFSSGKPLMSGVQFFQTYRNEIAQLRRPEKNSAEYLASLSGKEQAVFATMLPSAAAIKQKLSQADFSQLFAASQAFCLEKIDRLS